MFDLQSITLHNFRSYRGTHRFDLPTKPGLYQLAGRNKANPRLGPNGVGKSSLLEAVFWVLYGQTTRGVKGKDVVTSGEDTCRVTLRLMLGADLIEVHRQQAPNLLTISINHEGPRPCEQDAINKAIRLTADSFKHAVLFPQTGEYFFEMSAGAKLDLFTEIMGLDEWLERSKAAAAMVTQIESDLSSLNNDFERSQGAIEEVNNNFASMQEASSKYKESQDEVIAYLTERNETWNTELKTYANRLETAQQSLTLARSKLVKAVARQTELSNELRDKEKKQSEVRAITRTLKLDLTNVLNLTGACPTCRQAVSKEHVSRQNAKLKKDIDKLEGELTTLDAEIVCSIKARQQATQDVSSIQKNIESFTEEVSLIKQDKVRLETQIAGNTKQIVKERTSENPYAGKITAAKIKHKSLTQQIKQTKAAIDACLQEREVTKYWVGGFKRIRLMLIDQTLQQLEIEINNCLGDLGLIDWCIQLEVEREKKSGKGVTRGFSVLVHSPEAERPMRWEAWSGGENQRLRLAGTLGLANLIMQRAGLTNTIEFFDEPSHSLSAEGLSDLAEALHLRAIDSGRRIFLVDHHVLDAGTFAGVYTAVREASGTRLTKG